MAHAHDAWLKKALWAYRVLSILLYNLNVDVFKIIFYHCLGGKSVALRVVESARREGFMGGPAKSAIQIDRYEGEGVFSVYGGSVGWSQ